MPPYALVLLEELKSLREEVAQLRNDSANARIEATVRPAAYTLAETQKLLQCGRSAVYDKIWNGDLKRVPNIRKVLITRQSVENLLAA